MQEQKKDKVNLKGTASTESSIEVKLSIATYYWLNAR